MTYICIMTVEGQQESYISSRLSVHELLFEGLSGKKEEVCFNFRYTSLFLSEGETAECKLFDSQGVWRQESCFLGGS